MSRCNRSESGALGDFRNYVDDDVLERLALVDDPVPVIHGAYSSAIDQATPLLMEKVMSTLPAQTRTHRRSDTSARSKIRQFWGPGLDLLRATISLHEESGAACLDEVGPEADPNRTEAMAGLHARACRISLEVHQLLSSGFALGAMARCRTLHEISVTATVLSKFAGTEGNEDLYERFLLHRVVDERKDALEYDHNCDLLGYEKHRPDQLATISARAEAVITRFGPKYARDYGWAHGIPGAKSLQFRDLEKLAGTSHLRSHYRYASHDVHSSSQANALNEVRYGNSTHLITGPTNEGLAMPGHLMAILLHQVTCQLLIGAGPRELLDLVKLRVLGDFVDEVGVRFQQAHKYLAEHAKNASVNAEPVGGDEDY